VPNIIFLGVALFLRIARGQTLWFLTEAENFFNIIYSFLTYFLSNILLNILPFVILSVISVATLGYPKVTSHRSKKYAVISTYLIIFILAILIDLLYFSDHLSANPSSTAVLIFVPYHKLSMLFGGFGYGIGWIIGYLVDKIRVKSSNKKIADR